jgi:hypothetical protein
MDTTNNVIAARIVISLLRSVNWIEGGMWKFQRWNILTPFFNERSSVFRR